MKFKAVIHVAWWWRWYAYGLIATAWLTGLAPDAEKVARMYMRAMSFRCEPE